MFNHKSPEQVAAEAAAAAARAADAAAQAQKEADIAAAKQRSAEREAKQREAQEREERRQQAEARKAAEEKAKADAAKLKAAESDVKTAKNNLKTAEQQLKAAQEEAKKDPQEAVKQAEKEAEAANKQKADAEARAAKANAAVEEAKTEPKEGAQKEETTQENSNLLKDIRGFLKQRSAQKEQDKLAEAQKEANDQSAQAAAEAQQKADQVTQARQAAAQKTKDNAEAVKTAETAVGTATTTLTNAETKLQAVKEEIEAGTKKGQRKAAKKARAEAFAQEQADKEARWKAADQAAAARAAAQAENQKAKEQQAAQQRTAKIRQENAEKAAAEAAQEKARQAGVLRGLDLDLAQVANAMSPNNFTKAREEAKANVIAQEEKEDQAAKAANEAAKAEGKQPTKKSHETGRKVLHALGLETAREMDADIAWMKKNPAVTPVAYLQVIGNVRAAAKTEAVKTKDAAYKAELKERQNAAEDKMRAFVVASLPALQASLDRNMYFDACPGLRQMYREEVQKAEEARVQAQKAQHEADKAARLAREAATLKEIDDTKNAGDTRKAYEIAHQHFVAEIATATPSYSQQLRSRYEELKQANEELTDKSRPALLGKVTRTINSLGKKETLADKIDALETVRADVQQALAVTNDESFRAELNKRNTAIVKAEFDAVTARQAWNGDVALNEPGVAEAIFTKHPSLAQTFAEVVAGKQPETTAAPAPAVKAKKPAPGGK